MHAGHAASDPLPGSRPNDVAHIAVLQICCQGCLPLRLVRQPQIYLTTDEKAMETFDRQVRYFIKIAQVKSLSRAADDLGCTQPALSRQLAVLEEHIGCTLFVRTGRGMELTDCGTRLLDEVYPSFARVDTALSMLRDRTKIQSSLKLASVHTVSYYFVGDLLKQFTSQHGGATFSLMGRGSPEVVELVESGKADLGLVYDTAVASEKIISTPLFTDQMCLIIGGHCKAQHGVDLTQCQLNLVGFPMHYALRRMIHRNGLDLRFVAEAETVDAMLEMVASGMVEGCILPERLPTQILERGQLRKIRIGNPYMSRRVVAISRFDRSDLTVTKKFVQMAVRLAQTMDRANDVDLYGAHS